MSTNNTMILTNNTKTTFQTFFLVTTNSGVDIAVTAGTNLINRQSSLPATFNVDKGEVDTFMVFFVGQDGNFWQSSGNVADLSSDETSTVAVTVAQDANGMNMSLTANNRNFGPWPIYQVPTVSARAAAA